MKHLTVLATFLLVLAAAPAAAHLPPTEAGHVLVRSKALDNKALEISLANLEQQNTTVELKSLDGDRTYLRHRITDHNGFRMRIDLSTLDLGKYLLTIEQEDEAHSQVIVIEREGVLLSKVADSAT